MPSLDGRTSVYTPALPAASVFSGSVPVDALHAARNRPLDAASASMWTTWVSDFIERSGWILKQA
jgi:hypothetical protein